MSLGSSRRVVIDDTNRNILYSNHPPWFTDTTGIKDNNGNFGKTFNSTLHKMSGNGSFSFSFSGTAVDVYGTTTIRNKSGAVSSPFWTCSVDTAKIPSTVPIPYAENNWRFCGVDKLPGGNHTLTVSTNTGNETFWFDYLLYTPSNATPGASIVYVPHNDSAVVHDSNWVPLTKSWTMTRTKGASLSFTFTGTNLSWYGMYPKEFPNASAPVTYTIDGGDTTGISLKGVAHKASTVYNQLVFQTGVYPIGQHTLLVEYKGDNMTTPLVLDYLLVQRGTPKGTASIVASSASPPSPSAKASTDVPIRPLVIAGFIMGLISLFLIVLLVLCAFRKRRRGRVIPEPATCWTDLDLGSSTPSLYVASRRAPIHSWRSTWVGGGFPASLLSRGRESAPVLPPDGEQRERVTSRWTFRKSESAEQSRPAVIPQMTNERTQEWTHGDQGQAQRNGHGLGNEGSSKVGVRSHSDASPAWVNRSDGDVDTSYYGGYRTQRDVMEIERKHGIYYETRR